MKIGRIAEGISYTWDMSVGLIRRVEQPKAGIKSWSEGKASSRRTGTQYVCMPMPTVGDSRSGGETTMTVLYSIYV